MTRFHASTLMVALSLCLVCACETVSAPGAADADANADASDEPPKRASGKTDMERFTGKGIVDLSALLHKSPEDVEAILGAPTETGVQRVSCVRFVPERVFFGCTQEARFYPHPKLERIEVEYEDGLSATVALASLPGEGEFTPDKALAIAGLALPGAPKQSAPTFGMGDTPDKVDAWDWYNSAARLRVDGREFRVRLSIVDGDWKRSKIEVINNDPLNEDEKQRVKASKGDPGVSEDPGLKP